MQSTETHKAWTNVDAGPIIIKRVNDAISKLNWEAKTFVQVTGVIGGEEHRSALTQPVGGVYREDVKELAREIGERYGWQVTAKTNKAIIEDLFAALEKATSARPERDERITPEEDRERQETLGRINREYQENAARADAMRELIRAKAPPGAQALIVAELKEDTSDPITDYFANKTVRSVAIGFRFSKREDFRALQAAAGQFSETAHLSTEAPKDIEHRDNFSMGRGNYLSDHGWDGSGSGWIVRSCALDGDWWSVDEEALPDGRSTASTVNTNGYEIRPSSLGRPGVIEVRFPSKPPAATLAVLRSAGFRWARGNRCWYGRAERLELVGLLDVTQ
jgi:hypothetical protein